ncbi:MAG: hypothetical protein KDC46_00370 [Thermoleophilia bacterium]|nr:hypothetical protein [Thermoleophilia bacterium]
MSNAISLFRAIQDEELVDAQKRNEFAPTPVGDGVKRFFLSSAQCSNFAKLLFRSTGKPMTTVAASIDWREATPPPVDAFHALGEGLAISVRNDVLTSVKLVEIFDRSVVGQ